MILHHLVKEKIFHWDTQMWHKTWLQKTGVWMIQYDFIYLTVTQYQSITNQENRSKIAQYFWRVFLGKSTTQNPISTSLMHQFFRRRNLEYSQFRIMGSCPAWRYGMRLMSDDRKLTCQATQEPTIYKPPVSCCSNESKKSEDLISWLFVYQTIMFSRKYHFCYNWSQWQPCNTIICHYWEYKS